MVHHWVCILIWKNLRWFFFFNRKVESDDFFPGQISKQDNSDFEVLGVHVGSGTHTLAFLQHKVEKAIRLMEMLEQLDDPQVAYTLLRTCARFLLVSFVITSKQFHHLW